MVFILSLINLDCSIEYNIGTENDNILVYNQDFIDGTFSDKSKIQGIYTLGKDAGHAKEEIEQLQEEVKKAQQELTKLDTSYESLSLKKTNLDTKFTDQAWEIKTNHYKTFKESLTSKAHKKDVFTAELINIKLNKEKLITLDELKAEYTELYSTQLTTEDNLTRISNTLSELEENSILDEVIKGNNKLDINELIDKLNNADWIKQGLPNVDESTKTCPFCQQNISDDIFNQLKAYFNKEYEEKLFKLNTLYNQYMTSSQSILDNLNNLSDNKFITNLEVFNSKLETLRATLTVNIKSIGDKIKNPSKQIKLNNTALIINNINSIIDEANNNIKLHNEKVNNISRHKDLFKANLWNYFASEIETDLVAYNTNIININKNISEIEKQRKTLNSSINIKWQEITKKESSITGIAETIENINKILRSFGFTSFKLKENDDKTSYKVIRENNSVAKKLSEGEEKFIAFLYFYYLTNGSINSSGTSGNKVIVIDDPVCSMDSNTLFIVVALIKKLKTLCLDDNSNIKQLLLLTHNVYFYREIIHPLKGEKKKKHHFFIIKKIDNLSSINPYEENQIKNSYQLLWEEIKSKNKGTIANAMRRVLEYYFNLLGDKDYKDNLLEKFSGEDQIICNALLTFINAESHTFEDEINVIVDETTVDKYSKVFMKIFEKSDNISHYNMMMKIEEEDEELSELQKSEFNLQQKPALNYTEEDNDVTINQ